MGYDGKIHRYNHEPGTMVLYESAKVLHGRPYRNRHGVHVAAFLHYKPKHLNAKDAAAWDDAVQRAHRSVSKNSRHTRYVDRASIEEPAEPKYTKTAYGAGSSWKHDRRSDDDADEDYYGEEDDEDSGMFTVTFINASPKKMSVYWMGGPAHYVLQGNAAPGASFGINTFQGHKFFWAETVHSDDDEPKPLLKFSVDRRRQKYTYGGRKKGKGAENDSNGGVFDYLRNLL